MAHFTDDALGLMRVTCPLLAAESKQKQKIISSHSSCFANLFALFNSTTHEAIWKTGQNFLPFIHCFLRIQKSIFAYISVKQHRNKTNKKRNCWHSGWVGIVCVWQVWLYSSSFYASQKCNKEASFQKVFLPAGQCRNGKVRVLKGCPRKKFHFLASEMRSAQADQWSGELSRPKALDFRPGSLPCSHTQTGSISIITYVAAPFCRNQKVKNVKNSSPVPSHF